MKAYIISILLLSTPLAACNGHYLGGVADGFNRSRTVGQGYPVYQRSYVQPQDCDRIWGTAKSRAQELQEAVNELDIPEEDKAKLSSDAAYALAQNAEVQAQFANCY